MTKDDRFDEDNGVLPMHQFVVTIGGVSKDEAWAKLAELIGDDTDEYTIGFREWP